MKDKIQKQNYSEDELCNDYCLWVSVLDSNYALTGRSIPLSITTVDDKDFLCTRSFINEIYRNEDLFLPDDFFDSLFIRDGIFYFRTDLPDPSKPRVAVDLSTIPTYVVYHGHFSAMKSLYTQITHCFYERNSEKAAQALCVKDFNNYKKSNRIRAMDIFKGIREHTNIAKSHRHLYFKIEPPFIYGTNYPTSSLRIAANHQNALDIISRHDIIQTDEYVFSPFKEIRIDSQVLFNPCTPQHYRIAYQLFQLIQREQKNTSDSFCRYAHLDDATILNIADGKHAAECIINGRSNEDREILHQRVLAAIEAMSPTMDLSSYDDYHDDGDTYD